MKIIHVINSIDISTGGPARSVTHLINKVIKKSTNIIFLLTNKTKDPIITDFTNKNKSIFFLNRTRDLIKTLDKLNDQKIDLFHGHGIWQLLVHKMARFARKNNIPYIITPRGMLEPWSLGQKKIKKLFAMFLYQRRNLDNSKCIHATCEMEAINLRKLGFKNPIAIIPNGINLDEFPNSYPQKETRKKKILFLSRIHIKKGIENLIDAWKLIDPEVRKNWKIEIVGNGDYKYIKSLKEKIFLEKIGHQIEIKKPVFGKAKVNLFREANLFVLPTFSENFGIVIAEALASFTPVITTKGAPWEDLKKTNCGWWIDIGILPLKRVLEEAIQTSDQDLITMGINGRKLIENKYSMDAVASQMVHLYSWILNKKDKPEFVDVV